MLNWEIAHCHERKLQTKPEIANIYNIPTHRELKLDGAKGDFADPPLKAENWSFYYITVHNFGAP